MNRLIRTYAAPLLLSAGAALAQPTWDEGESFGAFRDEWNGWAESLPEDERAAGGLADVLERFNDERKRVLEPQRGIWSSYVVYDCRPWNEYWAFREEGLGVYQDELDTLARLAQSSVYAAQIPSREGQPDPDQDDEYLPSFWMQEYQVGSVSPIRDAVRYLVSDAVYHAFEARQDLAVQRFEAASRMCAFALELPTELGFMTKLPCRQVVREAIIESIEYDPELFNDAQLARLQALLISDLSTDYTGVWDFDGRVAHADWRASFKDEDPYRLGLLAAKFHDDASVFTEGGFSSFFTLVIQPDLDPLVRPAPVAKQIAIHERILKAMKEDLRASPVTLAEPSSSELMRAHLSGSSASRFIPIFVDTALWRTQLGFFHRDNYQTACQITVISIYRHRARHGEWPASLAGIDPEVLMLPAIDYFSGKPLRYMLVDGEPRLWALGADRDDDGGRPVSRDEDAPNPGWDWFALNEWEAMSKEQRGEYDGDLRILN
jgi:hypothetical protein